MKQPGQRVVCVVTVLVRVADADAEVATRHHCDLFYVFVNRREKETWCASHVLSAPCRTEELPHFVCLGNTFHTFL